MRYQKGAKLFLLILIVSLLLSGCGGDSTSASLGGTLDGEWSRWEDGSAMYLLFKKIGSL